MDNHLKIVLLWSLDNGIVDVEFTKKDGTIREMTCTRDHEISGYVYPNKKEDGEFVYDPVEFLTENPDAFLVYDLEIKDFRKITLDNVITFDTQCTFRNK